MKEYWEHFDHEADMGIRGFGQTLETAFQQVALALTAVVTDLAAVEPRVKVEISCEAPDTELLLVDWLNALIYEMWTRKMLFSRYHVVILDNRLQAAAWGQGVDINKHQPAVEIKGATYTELKVEKLAGGGQVAQCVVDV